jgi:opacity protein-like surface antigen
MTCRRFAAKGMHTMRTLFSNKTFRAWLARCLALLLLALASSVPALAQWSPYNTPAYELSGSFSYVRARSNNSGGFNLLGGSGEFTYNVRQWFALTADGGGYRFRGLPTGVNSTIYTYAAGPRVTFRNYRRITPFVQALIGGARLTASSNNVSAGENSVVMLAGGGVDVPVSQRIAIRPIQADYMLTRFGLTNGTTAPQHNLRLSAGIVFRFGER